MQIGERQPANQFAGPLEGTVAFAGKPHQHIGPESHRLRRSSGPALVVDGRYRSGSGFRSYEEMTEVVDHVVDKVLAQRQAQAQK